MWKKNVNYSGTIIFATLRASKPSPKSTCLADQDHNPWMQTLHQPNNRGNVQNKRCHLHFCSLLNYLSLYADLSCLDIDGGEPG